MLPHGQCSGPTEGGQVYWVYYTIHLNLKRVIRHPKTIIFAWGAKILNWCSSLIDIKFKKCRVAQVTQHALRVF